MGARLTLLAASTFATAPLAVTTATTHGDACRDGIAHLPSSSSATSLGARDAGVEFFARRTSVENPTTNNCLPFGRFEPPDRKKSLMIPSLPVRGGGNIFPPPPPPPSRRGGGLGPRKRGGTTPSRPPPPSPPQKLKVDRRGCIQPPPPPPPPPPPMPTRLAKSDGGRSRPVSDAAAAEASVTASDCDPSPVPPPNNPRGALPQPTKSSRDTPLTAMGSSARRERGPHLRFTGTDAGRDHPSSSLGMPRGILAPPLPPGMPRGIHAPPPPPPPSKSTEGGSNRRLKSGKSTEAGTRERVAFGTPGAAVAPSEAGSASQAVFLKPPPLPPPLPPPPPPPALSQPAEKSSERHDDGDGTRNSHQSPQAVHVVVPGQAREKAKEGGNDGDAAGVVTPGSSLGRWFRYRRNPSSVREEGGSRREQAWGVDSERDGRAGINDRGHPVAERLRSGSSSTPEGMGGAFPERGSPNGATSRNPPPPPPPRPQAHTKEQHGRMEGGQGGPPPRDLGAATRGEVDRVAGSAAASDVKSDSPGRWFRRRPSSPHDGREPNDTPAETEAAKGGAKKFAAPFPPLPPPAPTTESSQGKDSGKKKGHLTGPPPSRDGKDGIISGADVDCTESAATATAPGTDSRWRWFRRPSRAREARDVKGDRTRTNPDRRAAIMPAKRPPPTLSTRVGKGGKAERSTSPFPLPPPPPPALSRYRGRASPKASPPSGQRAAVASSSLAGPRRDGGGSRNSMMQQQRGVAPQSSMMPPVPRSKGRDTFERPPRPPPLRSRVTASADVGRASAEERPLPHMEQQYPMKTRNGRRKSGIGHYTGSDDNAGVANGNGGSVWDRSFANDNWRSDRRRSLEAEGLPILEGVIDDNDGVVGMGARPDISVMAETGIVDDNDGVVGMATQAQQTTWEFKGIPEECDFSDSDLLSEEDFAILEESSIAADRSYFNEAESCESDAEDSMWEQRNNLAYDEMNKMAKSEDYLKRTMAHPSSLASKRPALEAWHNYYDEYDYGSSSYNDIGPIRHGGMASKRSHGSIHDSTTKEKKSRTMDLGGVREGSSALGSTIENESEYGRNDNYSSLDGGGIMRSVPWMAVSDSSDYDTDHYDDVRIISVFEEDPSEGWKDSYDDGEYDGYDGLVKQRDSFACEYNAYDSENESGIYDNDINMMKWSSVERKVMRRHDGSVAYDIMEEQSSIQVDVCDSEVEEKKDWDYDATSADNVNLFHSGVEAHGDVEEYGTSDAYYQYDEDYDAYHSVDEDRGHGAIPRHAGYDDNGTRDEEYGTSNGSFGLDDAYDTYDPVNENQLGGALDHEGYNNNFYTEDDSYEEGWVEQAELHRTGKLSNGCVSARSDEDVYNCKEGDTIAFRTGRTSTTVPASNEDVSTAERLDRVNVHRSNDTVGSNANSNIDSNDMKETSTAKEEYDPGLKKEGSINLSSLVDPALGHDRVSDKDSRAAMETLSSHSIRTNIRKGNKTLPKFCPTILSKLTKEDYNRDLNDEEFELLLKGILAEPLEEEVE